MSLLLQLRECLESEVYELFHKKLTEQALIKDPKFLWCCHVSSAHLDSDVFPGKSLSFVELDHFQLKVVNFIKAGVLLLHIVNNKCHLLTLMNCLLLLSNQLLFHH